MFGKWNERCWYVCLVFYLLSQIVMYQNADMVLGETCSYKKIIYSSRTVSELIVFIGGVLVVSFILKRTKMMWFEGCLMLATGSFLTNTVPGICSLVFVQKCMLFILGFSMLIYSIMTLMDEVNRYLKKTKELMEGDEDASI